MKRKPIDPYFHEVIGKTLQFEGTLYSMTPVIKETSRKRHVKCFSTICFHNVRELNSKIPFRQHVNVIVTEAVFNRILLDNRFFIGDTIQFTARVSYYESKKVNKKYNYHELSIGLKDVGNIIPVEGVKRQNIILNEKQFQRKGGMTTDKARNNFYKNNK